MSLNLTSIQEQINELSRKLGFKQVRYGIASDFIGLAKCCNVLGINKDTGDFYYVNNLGNWQIYSPESNGLSGESGQIPVFTSANSATGSTKFTLSTATSTVLNIMSASVAATISLTNDIGSLGQLFKTATNYSAYKNINPNDLGFYNTSGNLSVLNDGGNINFAPNGSSTPTVTIDQTSLTVTTPIKLRGYTVATLPVGTQGMTAFVTDATAPTYLGALTGGGTVTCPVFYNGTAWVSA